MKTNVKKVALVRPTIGEEEVAAVVGVMRTGQLAQGPQTLEFEKEFARACGVEHAVAVNSGTAALHCALEAVGVTAGDEVVTTPFTFAATATPILMQGAIPKFVDIDPRTFNADVSSLAASLSPRTKAVIAVDLFGLPVDITGVEELQAKNIAVVEDACQAIGGARDGKKAGALGNVGAFSLYATKNLMSGEGGVLTTNDARIASAARRFRHHGQGDQYEYLSLGYNYRMTDLAASIGRVQLTRLEKIEAARRSNARVYDERLAGIPGLVTPFVPAGVSHAYHQYSILIDSSKTPAGIGRDALRTALSERGIATGIYYPKPLHLHPLFAKFGFAKGDFPIAERVATQILALPIHGGLTDDDLTYVCETIRELVGADQR